MGFFLTGDNSYLSTVQILDSLGPRRVQVDRGGGAGCAGLPEIYRDSSIPRGERGKYAIRVGRTVAFSSGELKTLIHNTPYHTMLKMLQCTKSSHTNTIINQSNLLPVKPGLPPPLCCRYFSRLSQSNLVRQKIRALSILCSSKAWMTYSPFRIFTASE